MQPLAPRRAPPLAAIVALSVAALALPSQGAAATPLPATTAASSPAPIEPAEATAPTDEPAADPSIAGADAPAPIVEGPTDSTTTITPPPRPSSPAWIEGPAYRGTGLFVTAGLVAGVGLVQQAIAYSLLGGTCGAAQKNIMTLKTFDGEEITIEDGAQLAAGAAFFGLACVGAAGPALTLRMQTPLYLGAAVGLASAGGLARGRDTAFDDVFVHKRDRSDRARRHRVIGAVLLGAGVVLWGSSRLGLVNNRPGCTTLGCVLSYDLFTLQGSGAMTITGAALLASGLAHKRHYGRYVNLRDLGATPYASRDGFGVGVSGRF